MLKSSALADSYRIHLLAIALGVACLLLCTGYAQAERLKQRGVFIPEASDKFVQGSTRLDRKESGADLTLSLDANETWELLNRVLENLSIKIQEQDAQSHRLLTDWILWVWDPSLEAGRSKPPLKALSRTYERHRFEFSVSPDAANTGTLIHIGDSARQREVDITPDSEYTWLQWQDAPVQADAAWSFTRRLQSDFESALSSRLVLPAVIAPRIIEPVQPPASIRQAIPFTPTPQADTAAPAAVIVEPARTLPAAVPLPSQPSLRQSSNKPIQSKPPVVEPRQAVNEESTRVVDTPGLPVSPLTAEQQSAEQTPIRSELPQNTAMPPPDSVDVQTVTAPLAVQGGLLVDGGPDATWQALHEEIDALDIKLQSSDQTQHMLTTQWINAMYDKKNQQLTLESKTQERWAFDIWGKGHQRHRFQLILIPVDGGARTMVYAYHTGFQVETDRTPDSSQTLLYWQDHKSEPAIAMAFLRRLRLVVRQ